MPEEPGKAGQLESAHGKGKMKSGRSRGEAFFFIAVKQEKSQKLRKIFQS